MESEYRLELGRKRKAIVNNALQELKDRGLINDFGARGRGNDFYIAYISYTSGIYKFCPISVTGRGWVESKKRQHLKNQVICVGLEEAQESVKSKILRAIMAQERGWTF
jgi:hypothetical protein